MKDALAFDQYEYKEKAPLRIVSQRRPCLYETYDTSSQSFCQQFFCIHNNEFLMFFLINDYERISIVFLKILIDKSCFTVL